MSHEEFNQWRQVLSHFHSELGSIIYTAAETNGP
jgi:hypothetical protein